MRQLPVNVFEEHCIMYFDPILYLLFFLFTDADNKVTKCLSSYLADFGQCATFVNVFLFPLRRPRSVIVSVVIMPQFKKKYLFIFFFLKTLL